MLLMVASLRYDFHVQSKYPLIFLTKHMSNFRKVLVPGVCNLTVFAFSFLAHQQQEILQL
jgi:hypothetical protein